MKSAANFKGFLVRFVGALALTSLTYNPSGYSFFHWVTAVQGDGPVKVLVGVALVIGFAIYLGATYRSMGTIGMLVVLAFLATLIWVCWSVGWLQLNNATGVIWVVLTMVSVAMGLGLYWASIWRTLTGQVTVQDTNDIEPI